MKLLIAVDGSSCSMRAVRYVIRQRALFGKKPDITLLHVDAPMVERVSVVLSPEEIAAYHEKNGRSALRAASQALSRAAVAHRSRVLVGEPGRTIARAAKASRCKLIVMGSHGRGA